MSLTTRGLLAAGALGAVTLSTALLAPGSSAAVPDAAGTAPIPHAASGLSGAGSLVFVKSYNVWIARSDGSGARPLTSDGSYASPWLSPSQADSGEVVAAHAGLIVRMTPQGRVLNTIDPPALTNSAGHPMDGTPAYVAVSPNGALVAYTQSAYGCYPGVACDTRFATAYTAADRLTDPAALGTTWYDAPEWIGNGRTVQGGGAFREVNLQDVGAPAFHWYRDSEVEPPGEELGEPAVSRDGQWVATVRGWGTGTTILWSRVTGDVLAGSTPGLPQPWCETSPEPASGPAWSADSQTLAWTLSSGIWMDAGPADCSVQPALVVPGGSQPSFSAAPYVDRVAAPANTSRPELTGKARVGRTMKARTGRWSPAPSAFAYQWFRNGKPIRHATRHAYRVTRKDRGKKLRVVVLATGDGGTSSASSRSVRVRR